jgi:flagellar biosynthesis protein FliP
VRVQLKRSRCTWRVVGLALVLLVAGGGPAGAQAVAPTRNTDTTVATDAPDAPGTAGSILGSESPAGGDGEASISLDLRDEDGDGPSQTVVIILLLTLLAIAPALLIMLTSFTRMVVVLSLTRNGLGLHAIPPNQVIVGLAMFLSLFVMAPTLSKINEQAVQPYLKGTIEQGEAYDAAVEPIRTFMLKHTRDSEIELFTRASGAEDRPKDADDVGMAALVPAFILSELKTAFIIGFVIFVPFLVIDLVVSSSLMSMGMMMLPPVLISLPFKILLFVLVDGWSLVVRALLSSFS